MSTNATTDLGPPHGKAMDRNYRLQRHVYDLSRKYYLLGRDRMIDALDVPPGGNVLEIGCGTARNLICAAQRYPEAKFHGLDISEQMLKTAGHALQRANLVGRVKLACADAANFNAAKLFGETRFERVYFSYSLSMIPDWRSALDQACRVLAPGGRLHIVDFGSCERIPAAARSVLWWWLKRYHVAPRLTLFAELERLCARHGGTFTLERLHSDYAWIATVDKDGGRPAANKTAVMASEAA